MKKVQALNQNDRRILILAPIGRDGELTARVFRDHGLAAKVCTGADDLCDQFQTGAGLIFLTGECLTPAAMQCLVKAFEQQAPWSNIPAVVLTSGGGATPENIEALATLVEKANVTLIERPVR